MQCFLDTMLFGKLLTAVDRKNLPPQVLTETLLSPITALESAQHRGKLRIMRGHASHLRPLQSKLVRDPNGFEHFRRSLATKGPEHFRGELDALHVQCVMHGPFLAFHLSRYGYRPPTSIAGSQRFTSDVRDSMQLIMSQEIPFITSDADLRKKSSSLLCCHVINSDADLNCILATIRLVGLGWLTADKVGAAS
jgi:hypothetical protein